MNINEVKYDYDIFYYVVAVILCVLYALYELLFDVCLFLCCG